MLRASRWMERYRAKILQMIARQFEQAFDNWKSKKFRELVQWFRIKAL